MKVAALMTEADHRAPAAASGRRPTGSSCPAAAAPTSTACAREFGVPFERGPDELKDLPAYFGKRGRGLDLSRHDMRIFAEIVEASALERRCDPRARRRDARRRAPT